MIEVVGRLPEKTLRGHEFLGRPLRAHLVGRLAEGQRLGLGEEVGEEELVDVGGTVRQGVCRCGHGDEVARDELGALVEQLVERVLPVGARLAPEDSRRWSVVTGVPSQRTPLPLDSIVNCWR
jgi:hypothetical protein